MLLFLELLNSLLELFVCFLKVSLGSFLLLFEELELAFPESLVLVVLVVDISMHALDFIVLSAPLLNFLLN